jgi:hypothetical protein
MALENPHEMDWLKESRHFAALARQSRNRRNIQLAESLPVDARRANIGYRNRSMLLR